MHNERKRRNPLRYFQRDIFLLYETPRRIPHPRYISILLSNLSTANILKVNYIHVAQPRNNPPI